MVSFRATILKFKSQGEKTGWSYILITQPLVQKLHPGTKKSFRVKGKIDAHQIEKAALLPMGDGSFILAINAEIRKAIRKQAGADVNVELEIDHSPIEISSTFMECLADEPPALNFFNTLPQGHRNYFSKWIDSAKTTETKAKRIAQAVNALDKKMGFSEMIRAAKDEKAKLF